MARVAWGHTGRDIRHPPKWLGLALGLLIAGAVIRILFPLVDITYYFTWVVLAQVAWIAAFGVYLIPYTQVLIQPRVDG